MNNFVVSLDVGTSSCRCGIFEAGCLRLQKTVVLLPHRQKPGLSEYRAEDLLKASYQVLHQVLEAVDVSCVSALAISSQRSTVVLWDKDTGKSLGPVLTWEDGRAVQETAQATISQQEVHGLTGLYKTPYFSAPKITWAMAHLPEVQQALKNHTLCAGPVASYLIYHLTKGQVFATDPTLAQRTLLFDIAKGTWSEQLGKAFSVPLEILPQLKATTDDYGVYEYRSTKLPIRVCVGDQQAAAGALHPGDMLFNYGTGAFVLHHTGEKRVLLPGLLTSVAPSQKGKKLSYLLEGPVNAAGSAYLWLKTKGVDVKMDELDVICAQATAPLEILPALGGLGAPYWDFSLKPVIRGVTDSTTPADWAAGLTRAIALLMADIVHYMQTYKIVPSGKTTVSGGLSKSSYLMQFQSDVLQRPLVRTSQPEETLTGAALLAGMIFPCGESGQTFLPQISSSKAKEIYKKWQDFIKECNAKTL